MGLFSNIVSAATQTTSKAVDFVAPVFVPAYPLVKKAIKPPPDPIPVPAPVPKPAPAPVFLKLPEAGPADEMATQEIVGAPVPKNGITAHQLGGDGYEVAEDSWKEKHVEVYQIPQKLNVRSGVKVMPGHGAVPGGAEERVSEDGLTDSGGYARGIAALFTRVPCEADYDPAVDSTSKGKLCMPKEGALLIGGTGGLVAGTMASSIAQAPLALTLPAGVMIGMAAGVHFMSDGF